jgi:hypothetical protein
MKLVEVSGVYMPILERNFGFRCVMLCGIFSPYGTIGIKSFL